MMEPRKHTESAKDRPRTEAASGPRTAGAYRICTRCVMDTSDPDIVFDESGVCGHCARYETVSRPKVQLRRQPGALERAVARLNAAGRGKPYDCVLGVSGGLDSSYAAYTASKLGLRCLAVHIDNGWNTNLAVSNIQTLVDKLGMDLRTIVLDWDSFRDLQVAFLRSSTPDIEVPTDQAILAGLYQVAAEEGLRYVVSGENETTEGVSVPEWSQGQSDWRYIRAIHRRHGTRPLVGYPHLTMARFGWYTLVRPIRWLSILDYVPYTRAAAAETLRGELGWRPYKEKHGESFFTRFYQEYILPTKFGYDKRRMHLSTFIWAGQKTREEALAELATDPFEGRDLEEEVTFLLSKLEITQDDFDEIMERPPASYWDYPSYGRIRRRLPWLYEFARRRKRVDMAPPRPEAAPPRGA